MRAYDEAPAWGAAHPVAIALVLEHLAAEIMAQQHMRGSMDAHEVARLLLESSRPYTSHTGCPSDASIAAAVQRSVLDHIDTVQRPRG